MHSGMIFTATTKVTPLIKDLAKEPTHPNRILLKVKSSSVRLTDGHNVKEAKTNTEAFTTKNSSISNAIKNSGIFTAKPNTPDHQSASEAPNSTNISDQRNTTGAPNSTNISDQQNIAEDPKSANTPPQLQRAESGYESGTESISSNDEDSQLNPGSTFADITEYNLLIIKSRLAVENLEKDQEKKSQLEKSLENYQKINEENNQQLNEHFKGHIPMGNKNISDTKEVILLNKEEIKKLQEEIKSTENTIQDTRLDIEKFRKEKIDLEKKIWPETLSWYE